MNLVIFTPAVKTSAIGHMACLVTHALVLQGHDVVVVRTENESYLDRATHDFGVELIPWNDSSRVNNLAERADLLVYQIGDNYEFHHGCLEWLPYFPGIVCLHDYFLGHLFFGWSQLRRLQAEATLRAWYGNEAAHSFFSYGNSEDFIAGTRDTAPMTEWICSMAHGVITHSRWGIGRVLNSCPGPVFVVPLAYDVPKNIVNDGSMHASDTDPFRIVTIGHVNPNKRVASVIRAIGNSPLLRQRSIYSLVGKVQTKTAHDLSTLAENCQVNLLISGEVDDATLAHTINQADVVSCLRWPSLEAASASAIEAMLYGKATIVTDTGFYRELPDTCVKKIDPFNEISSLQSVLEHLCADSKARNTLGAEAKAWAEITFTPQNYSTQLTTMSLSLLKAGPVLSTVKYFTEVLDKWGGHARQDFSIAENLKIFNNTIRN